MKCLCLQPPDLRFEEGRVYEYFGQYTAGPKRDRYIKISDMILRENVVEEKFVVFDHAL